MPRFRFSLKSLFVLILGIAIGYSLNVHTLRLLLGPASEATMRTLPEYVIEPPDVLRVEVSNALPGGETLIADEFLVGPDGNIRLDDFRSIYVAGKTLDQAQADIENVVSNRHGPVQALVNVHVFNSKKYFVITKQAGGDSIQQFPITGNDTVLDALASTKAPTSSQNTDLWISRPQNNQGSGQNRLAINYDKILQGDAASNLQILPGDRVFIMPKPTPNSPL